MNMKKKMECPYCDGMADLKKEAKDLTYRKEVFKIMAHYYKCEKCQEQFTTTESDTISLTQAHNQYREKNNIPFPEEIAAIRLKYNLSASKMSEVLGLGTNGYSNYENGEIPIPAYGNLISATAEPATFLHFLDNSKSHFTGKAFTKARERVLYLIQTVDTTKDVCASLNVFNEPNNYTGYKKTALDKLASLVTFFIQNSNPEFNDKLKLNKQLFYTDFLHYKNVGASISGLSYRAIPYGPAPSNYDNIYAYLENEGVISSQFVKLSNGGVKEVFVSNFDFDKKKFSEQEQNSICMIIEKFKNIPTWDVVELSHSEKAWIDLESNRKLIGYQEYAFELKAI